ncbi:regulatory protein GemA [Pararhodobacter marinus]|uniref:regulatory protein GemA n=1 Tax=Pararhodobacter marinus TaxID=2184063 RepID=UPI003518FB61
MSDASYRSALVELAGVTSSTELDQDGFTLVMGFFEWRGFAPERAKGPSYDERPGMATFAQLELIRTLWREFTRGKGDEASLSKWLERTFKVSSLRFPTKGNGQKAITALRAMKARAA